MPNAIRNRRLGKPLRAPVATYTVTTTGAETHTIQSLGVSAPTIVEWGDGTQDLYTGTATRTPRPPS